MKNELNYTLNTGDGKRSITITTHKHATPGSGFYAKGVFALQEDGTDLGNIVFDDNMKQWEYTGMGNLTHEEAAMIAGYIQNKSQPAQ
ncbi:MAG: hypothetical protein ABI367_04675 [Mucilaginibacter sp.]